MHSLIHDIGLSVIVATTVGYIMHRLKQPVLVGYLLAGIIIGPEIGPQLVANPENIELISEFGLILLLFVIGLELDFKNLLKSGRQLFIGGTAQIVLSGLIGIFVFSMIVLPQSQTTESHVRLNGIYLGIVIALSSTAIVIKTLNDVYQLDSIHGKITVGVLILQDIFAIVFLAIQPNITNPELLPVLFALARSFILLTVSFLVSKYVLSYIFRSIANSPEIVVATSLGWCAIVAASANIMGLSMEMGALIAGFSIGSFPYSIHVTAKTLPLRDFFLTLFFISLGMKIVVPDLRLVEYSLLIVLVIYVTRFISLFPALRLTGIGRRNAFLSSLNLSQVSEFSLVIATIGISLQHIDESVLIVLLYAMVITAILSSYGIKYGNSVYSLIDRFLKPEVELPKSGSRSSLKNATIYLLGFHRGARSLVANIEMIKPSILKNIVVVDFNLEVLRDVKEQGITGIFGDISHQDTLHHIHIENAELILLTIPDLLLKGTSNADLVKKCRAIASHARIVATAETPEELKRLRQLGANDVILPYSMIGDYLSDLILSSKPVPKDTQ